ncbi:MAG: alpha/beta hydrolase, partial [Alphaproteobacteria bacterium]|nr:alpha/beta hydrolase [Alphaproteobacteria bacterium]
QKDGALLKLGQLIMAAPDVDSDLYKASAVAIRKLTKGMTLYASAADKALLASKMLAGSIARAGDVSVDGPIVIEKIDSIDATLLGEEMFGLNHSTYATSLSILNDVLLLLKGNPLRRVIEMSSVPEGVPSPRYWRYVTART